MAAPVMDREGVEVSDIMEPCSHVQEKTLFFTKRERKRPYHLVDVPDNTLRMTNSVRLKNGKSPGDKREQCRGILLCFTDSPIIFRVTDQCRIECFRVRMLHLTSFSFPDHCFRIRIFLADVPKKWYPDPPCMIVARR